MKKRRFISRKQLVESLVQHGYLPFNNLWIGPHGDMVDNTIFDLCGYEIRPGIDPATMAVMIVPDITETFREEWIEEYD